MDTTTIALIIAFMITITVFTALIKQTRRADRAVKALAKVEAEVIKPVDKPAVPDPIPSLHIVKVESPHISHSAYYAMLQKTAKRFRSYIEDAQLGHWGYQINYCFVGKEDADRFALAINQPGSFQVATPTNDRSDQGSDDASPTPHISADEALATIEARLKADFPNLTNHKAYVEYGTHHHTAILKIDGREFYCHARLTPGHLQNKSKPDQIADQVIRMFRDQIVNVLCKPQPKTEWVPSSEAAAPHVISVDTALGKEGE